MSKVIAIVGATGQQGGSVALHVLKELSNEFSVRAITRDPSSAKAQHLKELGAEVVYADFCDKKSWKEAFTGANVVFGVTLPEWLNGPLMNEYEQGKIIADAAVESNVSYLIFSTLANVSKETCGELTHVSHFDDKAEAENYIRTLPIKSSFYAPGFFFQNFHTSFTPKPLGDGLYAIFGTSKPTTTVPCIDITDTGKYIVEILKRPDAFEGKILHAAEGFYSFADLAKPMCDATGKDVKYIMISEEDLRKSLPPIMADDCIENFRFLDIGYYGVDTVKKVEQAQKELRLELNDIKSYLKNNPLNLN